MNKPNKKSSTLPPTRASLLSRLKNPDDSSSWQEFHDIYEGVVYGFARSLGLNEAEAKDATQETMIAVGNHIAKFDYDPARSFRGWLFTVAYRKAMNQHRRRLPLRASPKPTESGRTRTIEKVPNPTQAEMEANWDAE